MEIIDYNDSYSKDFKNLNLEWLEKYFEVEPIDHTMLNDPDSHIIHNGGFIFMAVQDNRVVGTVALLKVNDSIYELSKMAVTDRYQGQGIGKAMLLHCIKKMKELEKDRIILYSNTILTPAIELYKRCGFNEVKLDPSEYKRSNIKMELKLVDE